MIPFGQLTGAVLAGGESRRMGRDKATLVVVRNLMWQRQVKVLREAGAKVTGIVRRPGQIALDLPADIPLWLDAVSGVGPLAGIHAALLACRTPWLAILATDMPRIHPSWFQWLAGFCTPDCGAMARRPDGLYEPLAAIYPRAALAAVSKHLNGSDRSLQSLATYLISNHQLVSAPLPDTERWQVENWNTPSEVDQAAS